MITTGPRPAAHESTCKASARKRPIRALLGSTLPSLYPALARKGTTLARKGTTCSSTDSGQAFGAVQSPCARARAGSNHYSLVRPLLEDIIGKDFFG